MEKNEINICYIIGNALLYIQSLSFNDLEKIKNKLIIYNIDASEKNIYSCLEEWKDFFMFNQDNTEIMLTPSAKVNRKIILKLFSNPLDEIVRLNLFKAILYRNKENNNEKIIRF